MGNRYSTACVHCTCSREAGQSQHATMLSDKSNENPGLPSNESCKLTDDADKAAYRPDLLNITYTPDTNAAVFAKYSKPIENSGRHNVSGRKNRGH